MSESDKTTKKVAAINKAYAGKFGIGDQDKQTQENLDAAKELPPRHGS